MAALRNELLLRWVLLIHQPFLPLVCPPPHPRPLPRPSKTSREENYNKHFKNGGAGERVLDVTSALTSQQDMVDWMLKAGGRRTGDRDAAGGGRSQGTASAAASFRRTVSGAGGSGGGGAPSRLPPIGSQSGSFKAAGRAGGGGGGGSFKEGPAGGGGARSFKAWGSISGGGGSFGQAHP
jgi:hypothetical protein